MKTVGFRKSRLLPFSKNLGTGNRIKTVETAGNLERHVLPAGSKYGGMTANDVKRLKSLEEENAQLKRT